MIYHITTESEWAACEGQRVYYPKRFGKDGFIHCSTIDQVERIANSLFKDENLILLLCINEKEEKQFLKYENLEGGQELFPHIYRKLPKVNIERIEILSPDKEGKFKIKNQNKDS